MEDGRKDEKNALLGIELPFGWCLVRGSVLRDLQSRCRDAENAASIRSRLIGKMMGKIYDRKGRVHGR